MASPEPSPTTSPSPSKEWNKRRRHYKRDERLLQKRLYWAFAYGIGIAVVTFLLLYFYFREQVAAGAVMPLYERFSDWREIPISDADKVIGNPLQEVGRSIMGLFEGMRQSIMSNTSSMAGLARAFSLLCLAVLALPAYRRFLPIRYRVEGKLAQAQDFRDLRTKEYGWYLLTGFFYFGAVLFGAYVLSSVGFALLDEAFPVFNLEYLWAIICIAGFCGIATGMAVFWASVLDSREILLLGIFTWLTGLFLSFVLSAQAQKTLDPLNDVFWWCEAISNAGLYPPAAAVFTAAFLSGVLALAILYFDIDSLLKIFIPYALDELDSVKPRNTIEQILDYLWKLSQRVLPKGVKAHFRKYHMIWIRLFYLGILFGLLAVGFVRTGGGEGSASQTIHSGGVTFAIILIGLLTIFLPKRCFSPWYTVFSLLYLGILILMFWLHTIEDGTGCGSRIVSLTALELVALAFVVLWTYITMQNILSFANANWDILCAYAAKNKDTQ